MAESKDGKTAYDVATAALVEDDQPTLDESQVSYDDSANALGNLYVVLYPGKFLTACVIEVRTDEQDAVHANVFHSSFNQSAYTDHGTPALPSIRKFTSNLLKSVCDICGVLGRGINAVLVRTPPPARVFRETPEFLQANTFFEGFVVGSLFSLCQQAPEWYCHPNAVKGLFPESEPELWTSREEQADAEMSMAITFAGEQVTHERVASCVLTAVQHYMKYTLKEMPDRPFSREVSAKLAYAVAVAEKAKAKPVMVAPAAKSQPLPPPPPMNRKVAAAVSKSAWSKAPAAVRAPK
jgi:hypothetical protein